MHFSVGSTLLLVAFFLGNTIAEGRDLFDFNREGKNPRWQIVNDGVMGGEARVSTVLSRTDIWSSREFCPLRTTVVSPQCVFWEKP